MSWIKIKHNNRKAKWKQKYNNMKIYKKQMNNYQINIIN